MAFTLEEADRLAMGVVDNSKWFLMHLQEIMEEVVAAVDTFNLAEVMVVAMLVQEDTIRVVACGVVEVAMEEHHEVAQPRVPLANSSNRTAGAGAEEAVAVEVKLIDAEAGKHASTNSFINCCPSSQQEEAVATN